MIFHSRVLCLLCLSWILFIKSHTIQDNSGCQMLLSDYFAFWLHDFITVQKNQSFLAVVAHFPMPSANHRPHKIHFSTLMSEGLFADPQVISSFLIFFSLPPQSVLSLFIEHIHISQTYFRSKLTQPLEAPYPNMGSGISLCFFCSLVCMARMIFVGCPNLVNIWLWIICSGVCVHYTQTILICFANLSESDA